jgi:hypothetical protein
MSRRLEGIVLSVITLRFLNSMKLSFSSTLAGVYLQYGFVSSINAAASASFWCITFATPSCLFTYSVGANYYYYYYYYYYYISERQRRRLTDVFSLWRTGLNSTAARVEFVVDKVALAVGQVIIPVSQYHSTTAPQPHSLHYLRSTLYISDRSSLPVFSRTSFGTGSDILEYKDKYWDTAKNSELPSKYRVFYTKRKTVNTVTFFLTM